MEPIQIRVFFFQLIHPALAPFSLPEIKLGFDVKQLADTGKLSS
jgi:hypothetical protein